MAQIKKFMLPVFMAVMLIIINAVLFHSFLTNGEVIQSRDIYGSFYSTDIRSVSNRERLISSLSGNYEKDMEALSSEAEKLTLYKQVADYIINDNYTAIRSLNDLSPEERREKAETLYKEITARFPVAQDRLTHRIDDELDDYNSVTAYLEYLNNYKAYVRDISEQSDFLSDISIYNENATAMSNIIKTKKDFYGLQNIPLTPSSEDSFLAFLCYRTTDLLAVFLAFIMAVLPLFRQKISAPVSAFVTALGTGVMYLCNFLITGFVLGTPPLDISLQSLESFKSCPYIISTGLFTAGVILMKMLGAVVILSAVLLLAVSKGRKRVIYAVFVTLFFGAEILFSVADVPVLLKEINILSCFSFERFFMRYLNLNIFGMSISRLPVFIAFALIITAVLLILSVRSVRQSNLAEIKETEQRYYDEINRRYQESRKIRHDIQNHLLALNMLIESGNIDSARKYINEVSEQTDLAAMPVKTGSEVLDALLFKKTEQAQEKQVSLIFEVSCSLMEWGISDYDLCTVFGNIIDNAIEAVNEKDTVTVKLSNQHDMLYISCENVIRKPLKKRGDRILTTKHDPLSHGYGIARVREIAARYEGAVQITDEIGKFLIEILINPKNRI
ncbi:MAG: GHKL domain-containing protein [Ruminiclostridium sp.]|nr:GHKL domain-containing protein [Ruminiclostridium sp.]